MKGRILFVDDDESVVEVTRFNLEEAGFAVEVARDGEQAIKSFSADKHDVVVTDLRMPKADGMDVLQHVKKEEPETPVVVVTAHGNVETAVEAMKAGAYDFIEKPFGRDVLILVVQRALERCRLARENRALRIKVAGVEREIISGSPTMEELLETVGKVAKSDVSVLITGESGTGKELIARRLHARSHRDEGPFIPVNCAAIPSELLESELFGHERGAYTGAVRSRAGRFRKANHGTIFLDEIGEIPLALQGKLLRVLQEKIVDVVGSDQPVSIDVRVIAATNKPLIEHIKAGRFREDLYYRLNVVDLPVPPLRERKEDIEVLMRHFIDQAAPDRDFLIPKEMMDLLLKYDWPGNVRELENACERLVILSDGSISLRQRDLPPSIYSAPAEKEEKSAEWPPLPPEGLSLVDLERRVIERALQHNKGNVSQTSSYLRVPRHILSYRIEKYGINRD